MVVLGDVGLGISLGAVFSFEGSRTREFYAVILYELAKCARDYTIALVFFAEFLGSVPFS